jgi:mono/diheme cytochrome c family protein
MPAAPRSADDARTTREVTVTSGGLTRTFTLAELQGFPKVTLAKYAVTGSKMGLIGPYTWAGAALTDVLARVDATIANPSHKGSEIVLTSSDNWKTTLSWDELFASVPRGAALYNIKGCNECHGIHGEGSAPASKRAAPALAGRKLDLDAALTRLRAGAAAHGGINAYSEQQLARAELQSILDFYSGSKAAAADTFVPPPERRAVLLAYEKEGRPATGADGLIQLLVGPDESASRYGHWVKTVAVVPPAR